MDAGGAAVVEHGRQRWPARQNVLIRMSHGEKDQQDGCGTGIRAK